MKNIQPIESLKLFGFAKSLVDKGLIDESIAISLHEDAQQFNQSIVTLLIGKEIIDSRKLAIEISSYFHLPFKNLDNYSFKDFPWKLLDEKLIIKYRILPLNNSDKKLQIALADPNNSIALNEIKFHTQIDLQLFVVEYRRLNQIIDDWKKSQCYSEMGALKTTTTTSINLDNVPVIKFINEIFIAAIEKGASDIHLEPCTNCYRIRFRIDGLLHEIVKADLALLESFSVRLKILARLDISEKRLPQDGRFTLELPRFGVRDCRINTCPTLYGEKIVIRILQAQNIDFAFDINGLGMGLEQNKIFLHNIKKPEGLILVTGPTGSGKTNTLYTALNILNTEVKNIMTVEDPVEINLDGVNQIEINNKIGLTFAIALRAFLRQDPDIIMVGEIRDLETAQIAIRAAQTGHLVFSTLHTNSALDAITRLLNMGVALFNLASSLNLIIAQRLVRQLCPICKKIYKNGKEALQANGFILPEAMKEVSIYQAQNCEQCHKGYRGRTGVFEFLPFTTKLGNTLLTSTDILAFSAQAKLDGMQSLKAMSLDKILAGITSLEEVERVIG